ncbi:MAG: ribose-phosphate pyrophosphokinase [Lachnospiraceae bacterium]|nr:ribose-phosphate pyrophosphokinase [Lachnospiraceae bacterium]
MPSNLDIQQHLENESIPVAPLGLIVLPSAKDLGEKINQRLVRLRSNSRHKNSDTPEYMDYYKEDYRMDFSIPRFFNGEGRAQLNESARGRDIYILTDITNHSLTYEMNGFTNHMSPDDHFQDLKRVIAAINGRAHRITVIMPFLYEGRQHGRSGRESLDAAQMLKELTDLGIDNFITFDAHDPRIQNVSPLLEFDNFTTPYQFLRSLRHSVDDLIVDKDHIVVISPDEGALDRTVYFANVIGADTGMFYKRRDYSRIEGGKNPIVAHEFLGTDLNGKDAIIIDDMISSGGSILDTSRQLKQNMHAKRVFLCTTFGLFTDGLEPFDEAYEKGYFDMMVTTNLTYQPPELMDKPYFALADMSQYTAMIIDFMNHDAPLSHIVTPTDKFHEVLEKFNRNETTEMEDRTLEETEI